MLREALERTPNHFVSYDIQNPNTSKVNKHTFEAPDADIHQKGN